MAKLPAHGFPVSPVRGPAPAPNVVASTRLDVAELLRLDVEAKVACLPFLDAPPQAVKTARKPMHQISNLMRLGSPLPCKPRKYAVSRATRRWGPETIFSVFSQTLQLRLVINVSAIASARSR